MNETHKLVYWFNLNFKIDRNHAQELNFSDFNKFYFLFITQLNEFTKKWKCKIEIFIL